MFAKTSEQSQRDSNPCRHLERARRFIAGGSSPSNGVAFLRLETATVDDEWHHLRSPGTSCNRVVGWIVGFSRGYGPSSEPRHLWVNRYRRS